MKVLTWSFSAWSIFPNDIRDWMSEPRRIINVFQPSRQRECWKWFLAGLLAGVSLLFRKTNTIRTEHAVAI